MWPWPGPTIHNLLRFAKVLIEYERLKELFGISSYEQLRKSPQQWVPEYLEKTENNQEEEWAQSSALGSQPFVEDVKDLLGIRAKGRAVAEGTKGYRLREEGVRLDGFFEINNSDIALENTHLWGANV